MGLHELRWPSWFSHGSKDEILSAAKNDVSPSFYQTQSVAVYVHFNLYLPFGTLAA